jgi:hypothetical protein
MLRRMQEKSSGPSRATVVFAILTALLTVTLFLEVRENRGLRATLVKMTEAKARERGLEEGRALAPVELLDPAGVAVPVGFGGFVGTVFLFHSGGCDACAATAPRWRSALLEAARPDVHVVVAQTDGESARVDLEGLPASLSVPLPPEGWLAALPAVPATLVLDASGVLVRAWYGELDAEASSALIETLARLGS